MPCSVQVALAAGTVCSAMAIALMMKSLTESLKARGPCLRRERVQPRAGGHERIELAIDGEIEMRDGLL